MANDPSLPSVRTPLLDARGLPADAWRKFFERLSRVAAEVGDAALQGQISALAQRVSELEASGGDLPILTSGAGIEIQGQLTDPFIVIALKAYLADLQDVSETAPAEGDRLTWDAALALWRPAPAPDTAVPYFIPADETYSVAANKQALFTMPIDVEGFLDVEGYLVGVD